MSSEAHGIPAGPIETEPIDYPTPRVFPTPNEREGILRDIFRTSGVELGAYDDRIARWFSEFSDWSTFAVMASWVSRAAASSRAAVLNEQGEGDWETLEEAAQMYRNLRPVIERTMADPDRWDGDEDEAFHLGRYVEWLAAERGQVAAEVLTQAADEMDAHCEQYGVFGVGDRLRRMAEEKSSRTAADATPDFFQAGHTYAGSHGWKFRCDTVTTHPEDGEPAALGWRFFNGIWEHDAYRQEDWDVHQSLGHTDITGGGNA